MSNQIATFNQSNALRDIHLKNISKAKCKDQSVISE